MLQQITPNNSEDSSLEESIDKLGRETFQRVENNQAGLLSAALYSDKLITWAMEKEDFKVALLRFVDVLPSVSSSKQVVNLAKEYFQPFTDKLPTILQKAVNLSSNSLTAPIIAPIIRSEISSVAKRFISGQTPSEALKPIQKIRKSGYAFTASLLGEATLSEKEALEYLDKYKSTITILANNLENPEFSSPIIDSHLGERAIVNISVKPSALYSQISAHASDHAVQILSQRVSEILSLARERGAFVYLDMEESNLTSIIIRTFKRVAESEEFRDYPHFGIVLQAYLRRTETDIEQLVNWARKNRLTEFGVRLVKGAYWDTETMHASLNDWPVPVWQSKSATDACYERCSELLLTHNDLILPAFASHNIRSLCHAIKTAEKLKVKRTRFELQTLYGMAEPIKKTFSEMGYLVRDYVPIGEMIPGMGYLVRRILENTSNESFLRQGFHENESPESLLKKPSASIKDLAKKEPTVDYRKEFANCPLIDFSIDELRNEFSLSLEKTKNNIIQNPYSIQPHIGGKNCSTERTLSIISPEDSNLNLGKSYLSEKSQVETSIKSLHNFFPTWRDTPISVRSSVLFKAANLMQERRMDLAAVICLEAGKQWPEADGDVAEAIDFLRYYALESQRILQTKKIGDLDGEKNLYFYEPRGVTAVIAPWNFPLAIPCGMLCASLVMGNCTLLKPAEQTPIIARILIDLLFEAGLPKECIAFLPGIGEEIGPAIVEHPLVSTIVFTGSRAVGLEIIKRAASVINSTHVKRVIAEMGGKNAIIIDESADLDQAVSAVVKSSFGFQGQKCSACSRVYVTKGNYEKFISRLTEATASLTVGPPSIPQMKVGPLVDSQAKQRANEIVQRACKLFNPLIEIDTSHLTKESDSYLSPIIFANIPEDAEIMQTELFAPVLVVQPVADFNEALDKANNSPYALTGAIFSRSPNSIEQAVKEFRVGNLYINRQSTGAMVNRQPFGGFAMSGVGSKAGGPDYLQQFVIPRTVTENTIRRGFAPMKSNQSQSLDKTPPLSYEE